LHLSLLKHFSQSCLSLKFSGKNILHTLPNIDLILKIIVIANSFKQAVVFCVTH
jgi:hypothetical protein